MSGGGTHTDSLNSRGPGVTSHMGFGSSGSVYGLWWKSHEEEEDRTGRDG